MLSKATHRSCDNARSPQTRAHKSPSRPSGRAPSDAELPAPPVTAHAEARCKPIPARETYTNPSASHNMHPRAPQNTRRPSRGGAPLHTDIYLGKQGGARSLAKARRANHQTRGASGPTMLIVLSRGSTPQCGGMQAPRHTMSAKSIARWNNDERARADPSPHSWGGEHGGGIAICSAVASLLAKAP